MFILIVLTTALVLTFCNDYVKVIFTDLILEKHFFNDSQLLDVVKDCKQVYHLLYTQYSQQLTFLEFIKG